MQSNITKYATIKHRIQLNTIEYRTQPNRMEYQIRSNNRRRIQSYIIESNTEYNNEYKQLQLKTNRISNIEYRISNIEYRISNNTIEYNRDEYNHQIPNTVE